MFMADRRPMSEARRAANKKWNDENLKVKYDRIQLVVPKGMKDTIKAAADKAGESLNAYVFMAVCKQMALDGIADGTQAEVAPENMTP